MDEFAVFPLLYLRKLQK